ncbi:MAG: EFR1 family ferrodoxin [Treponema sp.]|jgi:ferredoxin/flavodoxin|nr:EFR1 family ferrodoxin [Treponema sp.]
MTNSIEIYWFSGTGNSLFVAKKIKEKLESLGYRCSLIPLEMIKDVKIPEKTTIGIVVPVAMQSTYPLVWDFLRRLPDVTAAQLFLVDTLGAYSGGIKGPVKKIVRQKGFTPIGAVEIIMPNLFLKKTEDKRDKKKIEEAERSINSFCERLHENKARWHDIPVYSTLLSSIYNNQKKAEKWIKMFPKKVTDKCINCGICIELCPKNCIDPNSKHIKEDSSECILCQRCLEYCPRNAIELKGHRFIKNNLITLQEMKNSLRKQEEKANRDSSTV